MGLVGLWITVVLLASAMSGAAQTKWNAASGLWKDSGNWTNGVPNLNDAQLTPGVQSYTVTVDEPLVNPFRSLIVSNSPAYQTTLDVNAAGFSSVTGQFTIGRSAVVNVNSGGEWTYIGTNMSLNPMGVIRDGGRLNIAGGSVLWTNLVYTGTGRSFVYVGDGSDGSLYVSAGRLEYWGLPPNANGTHQLVVGRPGGAGYMEVTGGRVVLGQPSGGQSPLLVGLYAGSTGTLVISGGELVGSNTAWNAFQVGTGGGYGRMIVTNTGYCQVGGGGSRLYVGSGNGSRGSLEVHAGYLNSGSLTVGEMNGVGTATGTVRVMGGSLLNQSGLNVGSSLSGGTALGTFYAFGGNVMTKEYGVVIGRARASLVGHGTVSVTGGVFSVIGTYGLGCYKANVFPVCGLVLGSVGANGIDETNAVSAYGRLEVSGGTITNSGNFVLGVSGGTGVVVQTGGRLVHTPGGLGYYTIVGYGAGTNTLTGRGVGTYDMSGGTYYTPAATFVGGVPTVVPGELTNTTWYSKDGAVGLLKVTGGSFMCSNTLYVGGFGTGTLAVGSNGVVRCNNLVLSNSPSSTLRFELTPAVPLTPLFVTNQLQIAAGAKLQVDMTGFNTLGLTKLLDCKTRSGSFDESNITITGGSGMVVQTEDEDIYLHVGVGTLIYMR
jgi:hypothetical protein